MTTQMRREILEQPSAVRQTIEDLTGEQKTLRALFAETRSVVLHGIGSSRNAALYGSRVLGAQLGLPCHVVDVDAEAGAKTVAAAYSLVIALSQSGESVEVLEAVARARRAGRPTIAITNERASHLAADVDLALITAAGEETAVPATKTFTTQMTALAVIAATLGGNRDLSDGLPRLADAVASSSTAQLDLKVMLRAARTRRPIMVVGSGVCRPVADEIALKLQETDYLPATSFSEAGAVHGPVALLEPKAVLVLVTVAGPLSPHAQALVRIAQERRAAVILLGGTAPPASRTGAWAPAPDLPEALQPIALTVPGQILAERLAIELGHHPDTPRGLSKITTTRETP